MHLSEKHGLGASCYKIAPMHAIHRYTSNVGGVTTGQVRHNSSLANEIAFGSYFQTGKRGCLVSHEKAALLVHVVYNIIYCSFEYPKL